MARSKPSLSAKLGRTTGLVLVAGSLGALSFSLGRNVTSSRLKRIAPLCPWCASPNN